MPERRITESGRHPFEFLALFGSVVIGLCSALNILWPPEISDALPTQFKVVWGVAFALGSGVALIGTRKRDRQSGILLEQIGLIILLATCWTFAAVLLVTLPVQYFPIVFLFATLGVACLMQWVRLEVFVRGIIFRGKNADERIGE